MLKYKKVFIFIRKGVVIKMDYIIIDLEWNQSPLGRKTEQEGLPFEIIEIGAVKLNSARDIVDKFHAIIKPKIYQKIHFKTQEIIQIHMTDLQKGISFNEAIKRFFKWCGNNYFFCTWGQSDLTELHRNIEYFDTKKYIDKPIKYYDIQKLFSLNYEGRKNPKTLEFAVDFLNLEKDERFHRALFDAEYTAKVFQSLDINIILEYYSLDYYNNPQNKEEEIYLLYQDYSKYISMEYETKEELMEDKDVRDMICYKCGKRSVKRIKWFTGNSKVYYCLYYCKKHGFLKGRIRIKRSHKGGVFAVKTLKLINTDDAAGIKVKQDEIRIKKHQKRIKKNSPL
jgi:DNA polymerase III epsilon subunit-like protein